MLVGLFFKPTMGTTHNMTCRMGTKVCGFMSGFRVTVGPRVAGQCTVKSAGSVVMLMRGDSHCSFFLLLCLALPMLVGAPCVLRL